MFAGLAAQPEHQPQLRVHIRHERCAQVTHVSADAAEWIAEVVAANAPQAVRCTDPFHIMQWATEALDEVRRRVWNEARDAPGGSRLTGAPYAGSERAPGPPGSSERRRPPSDLHL